MVQINRPNHDDRIASCLGRVSSLVSVTCDITHMKHWLSGSFCFVALVAILASAYPITLATRSNPSTAVHLEARAQTAHQRRPNIVLIFPDNLGWGEVGV